MPMLTKTDYNIYWFVFIAGISWLELNYTGLQNIASNQTNCIIFKDISYLAEGLLPWPSCSSNWHTILGKTRPILHPSRGLGHVWPSSLSANQIGDSNGYHKTLPHFR